MTRPPPPRGGWGIPGPACGRPGWWREASWAGEEEEEEDQGRYNRQAKATEGRSQERKPVWPAAAGGSPLTRPSPAWGSSPGPPRPPSKSPSIPPTSQPSLPLITGRKSPKIGPAARAWAGVRCPGGKLAGDSSIPESWERTAGRRARARRGGHRSTASFDRWGKRGPNHSGFLCYVDATSLGMAGLSPRVPSHRPPDARAALADPKLPPVRRQPETPSAPRPPAGAQPGEVAPRPRGPRGRSLPKFVNSWRWREGAAPNFRAERRGEGGAITHRSPRRRRRRRAARRKARPAGGGPACCAPVGGGAAGGGTRRNWRSGRADCRLSLLTPGPE